MRFIIGLLILLPFAGAWWLTIKIVDACIKKSDALRPLGIVVSLLVGGGSIYAGYFIGPIVGWLIMGAGGLVAIGGVFRSLGATKENIEEEELEKKQEKEWKEFEQEWAKSSAKKILEQGEIDDYERADKICNILDRIGFDTEAAALSQNLKDLKKKQEKELKKKQAKK